MPVLDGSVVTAGYLVVVLTVMLGGWCRYQINGRRFRRRTITGAQRFKTYGSAVVTVLWEGIVSSIATLFIGLAAVGGIVLTVMVYWPQ
jgi:hypothetical protein